jgi:homoserine O-acetyltransferase
MQALAGRNPAGLALDCTSSSDAIAWIEKRWQAHGKIGASAIDWIWQTYAYDAHDAGATPGFSGDLATALAAVEARTLIVAAPDDLYNPTAAAREAASLIPNARYAEIPSLLGHQAASGSRPDDAAFLNREIAAFLTA